MEGSSNQRVLFVDRDGTLNEDLGYVHRIADWKFIDGAIDGLRRFKEAGFALAIVSNQSGIGSGRYSSSDVDVLHHWLADQLSRSGIPISAIVYCPHLPTADCTCRKPRTALAKRVEQVLDLPIDYSASWVIGDKLSDIGFGRAIGAKTALLISSYWKSNEIDVLPTLIAPSLFEAARIILNAGAAAASSPPTSAQK